MRPLRRSPTHHARLRQAFADSEFTNSEAGTLLGIERTAADALLHHMAGHGLVELVRRGQRGAPDGQRVLTIWRVAPA